MSDWREHFARKVAGMRRLGAITGGAMMVNPYTPDSYANDVMFQVMLKMRESVNDEHYQKCCVDGVFDSEKWIREYKDLDAPSFWATGERGHYIETAYQEILALHPLRAA